MANSIQYDYKILDRYSAPLAKIRKATDKMRGAVRKASAQVNKMGHSFKKAGDKMSSMQNAVAGLGAGLALKGVISTTNDFEAAMNNVEAITVATAESMAKLRSQAKTLGATTQFSASQAADAMGFLGMAGLNTQQIMEGMPGTLQLAAAGGLDLAAAADIATNVLAQMGMKVSELGKVNDALAATASSANTNVLEMAEALKNVGTTASGLGINLNLTSALIGKMADAGVKGGEAGTLLRNAMTRAINPSKKAQKVFRKLGIDMRKFKTPDGKLKNFTRLIEKLKQSGATVPEIFTAFEERGGRAILALLTSGGPAIDKLKEKLDAAGGAAEKMAKTKMKGLPGMIKTLKSAFEGLVIAIGEKLTPAVMFLGKRLSKLFSFLATSAPKTTLFIAAVLSLGAAIPIVMIPLGFLISGMGTLLTLLTAITWPMVAIAAGVALVAVAFAYWAATNNPVIDTLKRIGALTWKIISPIAKLFGLMTPGASAINQVHVELQMLGALVDFLLKPFEALLIFISRNFEIAQKLLNLDFAGAFGAMKGGFSDIGSLMGIGNDAEITSKKVVEGAVDVKSQSKQSVDFKGLLKIAADKGTKILSAESDMNLGTNMEMTY